MHIIRLLTSSPFTSSLLSHVIPHVIRIQNTSRHRHSRRHVIPISSRHPHSHHQTSSHVILIHGVTSSLFSHVIPIHVITASRHPYFLTLSPFTSSRSHVIPTSLLYSRGVEDSRHPHSKHLTSSPFTSSRKMMLAP